MKINVLYLMSLFAVFILMSFNSSAYNNSTLRYYFSMGDSANTTSIYDVNTGWLWNKYQGSVINSITGVQGNALFEQAGFGVNFRNITYGDMDFGSTDFTINFWTYFTAEHDVTILRYGDDTLGTGHNLGLDIICNTSAITQLTTKWYGYSNIGTKSGLNYRFNQWHMITIVYHLLTYTQEIYVDGVALYNTSSGDIVPNSNYLYLYFIESANDEMSIWNTTLESTDINILYHSGSGLNYAETLASGSGFVAQNYTENTTNRTEENFTQPVNSTILLNNTFKVGNGYFSSIQCIDNPVNPQLDSYCNNTIYGDYGAGLGFYCDLDNIFPCSSNKTCMTYVADMNTSDELTFNLLKDCSTIQSTYQRFNFRCNYIESTSLYLPFLHDYIYTNHNINCSLFDTYSISSNTCTGEETWDWIADGRENDTFYSTGQCVDASGVLGCSNQCSPNDYRCGDIKTSLICSIQSDGCYDWSLNVVCTGSDVCKSSSGLCGPLITNNTCASTSDCAIGQNCCDGECISGTCSTTPETTGECGFLCGDGLKQSTRYVIVILILMFIIGAFTAVGFKLGNGMMGFTIGTVFSFFGLIIFTALGWIPAWIMILLILLSVAVIVLVGLNRGE